MLVVVVFFPFARVGLEDAGLLLLPQVPGSKRSREPLQLDLLLVFCTKKFEGSLALVAFS